jgi:transcriptional regulator with PAS, ATPase and Fis domain
MGNKKVNPCLSIKKPNQFKDIIGQSKAMQTVYDFILQAATSDAGVILYGESGTGKELVARAIHKTSKRCGSRFMAVNCGAIPEPILESEFFGYKNGAFTGAIRNKPGILDLADGGTLFLDEVGELTINMQAKLLRAIEGGGYTPLGGHDHKKPNFRIIAATNKDLKALVKEGQMRDDFFFRIHVISIQLPPLRDRKEDIPLLIAHFLERYSKNANICKISGRALETLTAYRWPGNVRELQNVVHRYVTVGKLELSQHFDTGGLTDDLKVHESRNLPVAVESFERQFIQRVLADTAWHRGQAASALGICRKTLQRKIKRHGLDKAVK